MGGWAGGRRDGWIGGRRGEGKGEVKVYEAYESKREKLRCLLLRGKRIFFYINDVITWENKKKSADTYYL